MKLFLHIHISEQFIPFSTPIAEWFKSNLHEHQYFDIDNNSDAVVISTAIKAINESNKIFVLIDSKSDTSPNALLKVIKQLAVFGKSNDLVVVHNGENALINKLKNGFQNDWLDNINDELLKSKIEFFFND